MLSAWLNTTVKVQRRSGVARNALNEPDWGDENSWAATYPSIWCRIEYLPMHDEFNPQGERISVPPMTLFMYEPTYTINPQDHITVLTSDDTSLVGQMYIIHSIIPEWDAMGNVHHYVAQIDIH